MQCCIMDGCASSRHIRHRYEVGVSENSSTSFSSLIFLRFITCFRLTSSLILYTYVRRFIMVSCFRETTDFINATAISTNVVTALRPQEDIKCCTIYHLVGCPTACTASWSYYILSLSICRNRFAAHMQWSNQGRKCHKFKPRNSFQSY